MKWKFLGPVIVGGMMLFSLAVWGMLPEQVPSHWNFRGEVDGWMARDQAVLFLPGIALALWLFLPMLRKLDPRRENYERFEETFWIFINVIVLFMAIIHVLTLGMGLGWPIDVGRAILVLVGILFVALGNYLPRVRSNWWIGIRTPWTLENETVWRATHRVAGKAFVAAGVLLALSVVLPPSLRGVVVMVSVFGAGLFPVVYSYWIWRRERSEAHS
jgi:uncharacterized membrane protein